MIKNISLLSILLFLGLTFRAQENIENRELIKKAWQRIYKSDQTYRGKYTNPELDCENLKKSIKLIQKYGYPREAEFGKVANAAWLPYVHAGNYYLNRKNFWIIEMGYEAGEINKDTYLNYFLKYFRAVKFGLAIGRQDTTQANIDYTRKRCGFIGNTPIPDYSKEDACSTPIEEHEVSNVVYNLRQYWDYYAQDLTIDKKVKIYNYEGKLYIKKTEIPIELVRKGDDLLPKDPWDKEFFKRVGHEFHFIRGDGQIVEKFKILEP